MSCSPLTVRKLPFTGSAHAEIESKFAEKVLDALGRELMPELSKALAAQAGSGDVKVSVNRNVTFPTRAPKLRSGDAASIQAENGRAANLLNATNSPIMPEPNKLWPFLRFLLAALIFAAIIYFVRYR